MIESSGPGYGDPEYTGGTGNPGYGWYPPPPPPPGRGGRGILSHLGVAVLAAAVGVGATLAFDHPATTSGTSASSVGSSGSNASSGSSGAANLPGASAVPQPATSTPTSSSGSSTGIQAVVNKVEPGMVIINSTIQLQQSGEEAAGTGMVINSDGLVLTNNHVIEDSTTLTATVVATGKTYKATVVGYDTTGDIALIKLQDAPKLTTVPLGNSSTVKAGTPVVALGNAEGGGTVLPAAGTITALNQQITASDEGGSITSETLKGMLETNADIVSGDSGGPLSTTSGQVIGMDTAGDSSSNQGQGENLGQGEQTQATGFAIPINTALAVAKEIAAGKASSTITIGYPPLIGIFYNEGTDPSPTDQAEAQGGGQGNPFGYSGGFGFGQSSCVTDQSELEPVSQVAPVNSGALVSGVICDSPAAETGMTAGSVITAVNGKTISTPDELANTLAPFKPGDTVTVTWVNLNGQSTTSTLHLEQGPPA